MQAELNIDSLRAGYGAHDILKGFSAALPGGVLSCILGPNGSGKTTLLRAIAGVIPIRAGRIEYRGADLARLKSRQRARLVSLVPQVVQDGLPLTVSEAVLLGRHPYLTGLAHSEDDLALVRQSLEAVGLSGKAGADCGKLSGGEWRRMLIAQGLAQQTPVLLLDEPTAFLDPPARHEVLQLLAGLARERGLVAVAVLHDLQAALAHTGHAVLMSNGLALAAGEPRSVLSHTNLAELYQCEPAWLDFEEVVR